MERGGGLPFRCPARLYGNCDALRYVLAVVYINVLHSSQYEV